MTFWTDWENTRDVTPQHPPNMRPDDKDAYAQPKYQRQYSKYAIPFTLSASTVNCIRYL